MALLNRRSARVAESDGLENRYRSNSIEGSNPSSSATLENRALKPITISSSYRFFYLGNSVMELSVNIVNSMYYIVVRVFFIVYFCSVITLYQYVTTLSSLFSLLLDYWEYYIICVHINRKNHHLF